IQEYQVWAEMPGQLDVQQRTVATAVRTTIGDEYSTHQQLPTQPLTTTKCHPTSWLRYRDHPRTRGRARMTRHCAKPRSTSSRTRPNHPRHRKKLLNN